MPRRSSFFMIRRAFLFQAQMLLDKKTKQNKEETQHPRK
jgi:hypothetical protein